MSYIEEKTKLGKTNCITNSKKKRNLLSNVTKQSREKQYFKENENNLTKIWKGVKEIILIKKN